MSRPDLTKLPAAIADSIRTVLTERKLCIVKPEAPTMNAVVLEHYGFRKACDEVALIDDKLDELLIEIGKNVAQVVQPTMDAEAIGVATSRQEESVRS